MADPKDSKGAQQLRRLVTPPRVLQQRVAKACKVSQQAVSSWMNHKAQPTPAGMRILKDEFGIPMEAWTEPPTEEEEPESVANQLAHGRGAA